MYGTELKLFAFHRDFAHLLADPVPAERFAEQPAAGVNHPAWVVGHLAFAADIGLKICGGTPVSPAAWDGKFGIGSVPVADPGAYPSKAELFAAYDLAHEKLTAAVPHADPAVLAGPHPLDFMRPHLQTLGEILSHILSSHEAFHLGQLSTWRRVVGFPAARG